MKNEVFLALNLPDVVLIQLINVNFFHAFNFGYCKELVCWWYFQGCAYKKFCYGHFYLLLCLSGMWFIVAMSKNSISFHQKVIINPKQRGL